MSVNDQQASNWWIGIAPAKQNAIHKCNFCLQLELDAHLQIPDPNAHLHVFQCHIS